MSPSSRLAWGDLGHAIVETARAPLIVLDDALRVRSANPAFYSAFGLTQDGVLGRDLFEIGGGQWDAPRFRELLEDMLPSGTEIRDLEIRTRLKGLGPRVLLVNARQIQFQGKGWDLLVLSLEDVTRQAALEAAVDRHTREIERSNRELAEFAHAAAHDLPVVVLTTSGADEDIMKSYDLGASSFIRKPVSFQGLVEAIQALGRYWLEIVELPEDGSG